MFEGKCINEDCPANEVWVLDDNEYCNTCGEKTMVLQTVPPQKFADPDKVPDPAGISKGA